MACRYFILSIIIILPLMIAGCNCNSTIHQKQSGIQYDLQKHTRPINTVTYSGNRPAVIYVINEIQENKFKDIIDRIIRVFAESGVPVDVALHPYYIIKNESGYNFLIPYSDSGLIDISLDGNDINWLDIDAPNESAAYNTLKEFIENYSNFINQYFGYRPVSCIFPYELFNEYNYKLLQETGFKIISCKQSAVFVPSRKPLNWAGKVDQEGLYRLPIISAANYPATNPLEISATTTNRDVNENILNDINIGLNIIGVAVISIEPDDFVDSEGKINIIKIQQLADLVNRSKNYGEIVTFSGWSRYSSKYIGITQNKSRVLPAYNGGPAVIFRLDDVCKNWYEDIDKALIEMFKENGVPVDCGVISNANGIDSYELPWLKKYFEEGAVGISLHGFDWTYYQLDTTKSNLTFEEIKSKLLRSRDSFLAYYGVEPVAITVPTDFYDKSGYQAVVETGFKIFSTQVAIEPHPSNVMVDYEGKKTPFGLYRLPTASDVCAWDNITQRFTEPFDISKLTKVNNYCNYYNALSTTITDDTFGYMLCSELSSLGVAVVSLHPTAFVDTSGNPDYAKLQKIDAIIKWVKSFASITTFEQWHNFYALTK